MCQAPRPVKAAFNRSPKIPRRRKAFSRPAASCQRNQKHCRMCRLIQPSSPEERDAILGQLEVIPPASDIALPGVAQFFTGATLVPAPHLPYFCFEPFDTFRRYSPNFRQFFNGMPMDLRPTNGDEKLPAEPHDR